MLLSEYPVRSLVHAFGKPIDLLVDLTQVGQRVVLKVSHVISNALATVPVAPPLKIPIALQDARAPVRRH